VCSIIATVRAPFCSQIDKRELGRAQLALWSESMRRALAYRDQVGDAAFADVRMDDIVKRPLPTLGALYERLGLSFTREAEARMRAWLEANPQGRHGAHTPNPADFGLEPGEVRKAFRDYTDRFEIRLEA
jgi:hypothetical protein